MACNIVLVIITCNSLDFRFLHPSVYIDLILIVFGFREVEKKGVILTKKAKLNISILRPLITVDIVSAKLIL